MEINGKPVVNAKRAVVINITPKDVAAGDNKNPSACAAALAAKHSLTDCLSARVHIGRVYIEQKDKWVRFDTPEALRTEIVAFDKGGSFQPGEYKLRPLPQSETTEGQREWRRGKKNRNRTNNGPSKSPRKTLRVAKVKHHEVTGIRPRGANR